MANARISADIGPSIDVNQPGAIPGVTPAAQPGVTAPGFLPGGQIPGVNAEPTGPST
jgi:hypothetical protein